jgi:hypothetical protein
VGQLEDEYDADAIAQLAAVGADLSAPRSIRHYIYVPNRGSADSIANELRQCGFRIEQRLGADDLSWLVLATHEAVLSEAVLMSARRSMEALVAKFGGGEYDGWEADVRPHTKSSSSSH